MSQQAGNVSPRARQILQNLDAIMSGVNVSRSNHHEGGESPQDSRSPAGSYAEIGRGTSADSTDVDLRRYSNMSAKSHEKSSETSQVSTDPSQKSSQQSQKSSEHSRGASGASKTSQESEQRVEEWLRSRSTSQTSSKTKSPAKKKSSGSNSSVPVDRLSKSTSSVPSANLPPTVTKSKSSADSVQQDSTGSKPSKASVDKPASKTSTKMMEGHSKSSKVMLQKGESDVDDVCMCDSGITPSVSKKSTRGSENHLLPVSHSEVRRNTSSHSNTGADEQLKTKSSSNVKKKKSGSKKSGSSLKQKSSTNTKQAANSPNKSGSNVKINVPSNHAKQTQAPSGSNVKLHPKSATKLSNSSSGARGVKSSLSPQQRSPEARSNVSTHSSVSFQAIRLDVPTSKSVSRGNSSTHNVASSKDALSPSSADIRRNVSSHSNVDKDDDDDEDEDEDEDEDDDDDDDDDEEESDAKEEPLMKNTADAPGTTVAPTIVETKPSDNKGGFGDRIRLLTRRKDGPNSWLRPAIFVTLCINLPFGLAALYFACRAERAIEREDMIMAKHHGQFAKWLCFTGLVLTIAIVACVLWYFLIRVPYNLFMETVVDKKDTRLT